MAASLGVFGRADRVSNIQWALSYANGRTVTNSSAYFEIDADQTRFSGNAGCNRMFGTVALNDRWIAFSNVGTTKMMCKLPSGSVSEMAFLNAMAKASRYAQLGNTLHIYDRNGRTVLRFNRPVKQPPVDTTPKTIGLDDRTWFLESIKNRKTLVAIRGAFVNFDKQKGSAGGNSGCNVFGGDFSAKGSKINITDVISTMRACTEGGKMDVEREFFDGLRNAGRFEIKDARLFLYNGKYLLLTLRGVAGK
ncbi:MAG: META domain-containing protein [Pyrinomonadaceae bacterium]